MDKIKRELIELNDIEINEIKEDETEDEPDPYDIGIDYTDYDIEYFATFTYYSDNTGELEIYKIKGNDEKTYSIIKKIIIKCDSSCQEEYTSLLKEYIQPMMVNTKLKLSLHLRKILILISGELNHKCNYIGIPLLAMFSYKNLKNMHEKNKNFIINKERKIIYNAGTDYANKHGNTFTFTSAKGAMKFIIQNLSSDTKVNEQLNSIFLQFLEDFRKFLVIIVKTRLENTGEERRSNHYCVFIEEALLKYYVSTLSSVLPNMLMRHATFRINSSTAKGIRDKFLVEVKKRLVYLDNLNRYYFATSYEKLMSEITLKIADTFLVN